MSEKKLKNHPSQRRGWPNDSYIFNGKCGKIFLMGLMDSMKQLGDLKKMRDQAMEVQKKLSGIKITVEHKGVTVVMTADQKVVSITGENDLEKVTDAINEALKQSQKVAAEEMKSLMGGLMPGM